MGILSFHVSACLFLTTMPKLLSPCSQFDQLQKRRWQVWLFQGLLRSSDEWHFTRSPWTQPQLSLKYISHWCTHFGFSGVTNIYSAEETSLLTFQRALCYLIFLFKTCFEMSTFLKGDLSWSPEPIQMKWDKVLKENTHFRIESLLMKNDMVSHCSQNPFIHKK